jgi:peroxin-14
MATVVGGVSYGLYELGKRYVYPNVAPPTPEKLEQDKKSIEDQFDRAFTLVEQLAKDTESLKNAEKERTEKLDTAIADLETVMTDLKAANRRREDDANRIRDEVQSLKDAIPKALENQKSLTDGRLREINSELTSLKTLVSQRMSTSSATTSSYLVHSTPTNLHYTHPTIEQPVEPPGHTTYTPNQNGPVLRSAATPARRGRASINHHE